MHRGYREEPGWSYHASGPNSSILIIGGSDTTPAHGQPAETHDRYANIQTGYPPQHIEPNEGFAILTTNLNHNTESCSVCRNARLRPLGYGAASFRFGKMEARAESKKGGQRISIYQMSQAKPITSTC